MKRFSQCGLVFGLMVLLFSSGCHTRFYTFNLRRSYNLAIPDRDWPGNPKKKLTFAQREIFEKRGTPDFIRFFWNGSDNFPTETNPQYLEKEAIAGTRQSWIYLRQGDEVVFDSPFSSHSVPISDKLAIVIKEGDPEARQVVQDPDDAQAVEEVWDYPSSGKEYKFHGETLFSTRQVNDPMGSGYLKG